MIIDANKITFIIKEKLKHTRPGAHQKPLIDLGYAPDKKLCIVTHLQEHLKRTSALRCENKQLLISFIKLHKPISTETTSHWIKNFMSLAGSRESILHNTKPTVLEQRQRLILPPNILTSRVSCQTKKHFNVFIILIMIHLISEIPCWTQFHKIVSVQILPLFYYKFRSIFIQFVLLCIYDFQILVQCPF